MCPFSGTLENIDVTVCGIYPLIAERSVTGSKSQKIVFFSGVSQIRDILHALFFLIGECIIHFFRLFNQINLIRSLIGLDSHIVIDLRADILYTDAVRFFMRNPDNIRMVFRKCLSARTANLTGLFPLSGTLQRHGENPRDKFFTGIAFSVDNIGMRYFLKFQRSLQMLADLFLPDNILKSRHVTHLLPIS